MSRYPSREDRDALKNLLVQYENLRLGKAHDYFEEDDFERVVEYFEDKEQFNLALEASALGLDQFPFSASLMICKGAALISLRRYQEALEVLEQSAYYDQTDTALYILKTEAYLALDKQEKAIGLLESALELFEGEEKLELLFELADVYDDYEQFEQVFDCLKLILEIDPTNEEALYKICFWTDFTGRNEESIRLHQHILDEHPFCELAWFNLGAAYQGLKLYEKCIDAYQYALAIDEKFDFAYRNMGDAYIKLKKYRDAIEVLEKVIELSMPEAVIYEAIGHCYDKMAQYAQARFHYKKASHLNPEESLLTYKVACTYMNEGNFTQAIRILETTVRHKRNEPDFHLAMGRCRMELGQMVEAVSHFSQVVKARPRNAGGWMELLNCLYRGGLYEEGLEYSIHAHSHLEGKPVFLFYNSLFQFALGRTREALLQLENGMQAQPKLFRHILELNPSLLQNQQVIEVLARYKGRKKR